MATINTTNNDELGLSIWQVLDLDSTSSSYVTGGSCRTEYETASERYDCECGTRQGEVLHFGRVLMSVTEDNCGARSRYGRQRLVVVPARVYLAEKRDQPLQALRKIRLPTYLWVGVFGMNITH